MENVRLLVTILVKGHVPSVRIVDYQLHSSKPQAADRGPRGVGLLACISPKSEFTKSQKMIL